MIRELVTFTLSVIALLPKESLMQAKQEKCLGLVLKGGANRGSYEAGALYTLIQNLPPEEVQYDVVSGISVGALNAAHCSTYPKGDEVKMAAELINLWTNISAGHLYRSWKGGIIAGLLWQKGLYDTTPMHDFLHEYFYNRTIYRKVHFNSVDARSGNIISFDENTDKDSFIKGLQATTAVPFVFPSVELDDKILVDGGVAWNLDIASAIEKCRSLVDSDSQITLDIIDVDRSLIELPQDNQTGNTIHNFLRYIQIKHYYFRMNDHIELQLAHPDVTFRHVIIPKVKLDPLIKELSFDQELIQRMINQGMQDTLEILRGLGINAQ